MYLKAISCEIMLREVCHVAATSPHVLDLAFLDQGHHDRVEPGRLALQAEIDAADRGYDAVLLGYGLCNNLIAGLQAGAVPLVVPRAHDCITLFLGSRHRYETEFHATPGTYWYTSGWLECRRRRSGASNGEAALDQTGADRTATYESYVKRFGEDNAQYLMETLHSWDVKYERGALIRYDFDAALRLDEQVKSRCAERGWRYDELRGDLDLLRRWLHGEWDGEDFLTVPPGESIRPIWDGSVIAAGGDSPRLRPRR